MNPEKSLTPHFPPANLFLFILLSLFASSCITQRNLEYMRDRSDSQTMFKEAEVPDYRLQANDALYIQISSLDDAASNVFAQAAGPQTLEPYGAYMNSYTVDKDGFVMLPVLGKINVLGKTTTQVTEIIKDSVTNMLSLPTITVRLVNRYVSILGEVRSPGHFVYSQDKLTIFNAIGMAGDISEYGNRRKVLLTRNENGKNIRYTIDLTKPDILGSPYYLIQPNDLIYVSSMRKRFWGMREFPFTIILSTITTGLVIYTIVEPNN